MITFNKGFTCDGSGLNVRGLRFCGTYEDSYRRGVLQRVVPGGWRTVAADEESIVRLAHVNGLDLDRIERPIIERAFTERWTPFGRRTA